MRGPKSCTAPELAKFAVEIVDFVRVKLMCHHCQAVWVPEHIRGRLVPAIGNVQRVVTQGIFPLPSHPPSHPDGIAVRFGDRRMLHFNHAMC